MINNIGIMGIRCGDYGLGFKSFRKAIAFAEKIKWG